MALSTASPKGFCSPDASVVGVLLHPVFAHDRTAPLLPWNGAADVQKLSPVEVSARLLSHVRDAWDAAHPGEPLSRQELVLTLPASFDEVARELTVRAKKADGSEKSFKVLARIDTPKEVEYYRHGGILQYVLRQLLAAK